MYSRFDIKGTWKTLSDEEFKEWHDRLPGYLGQCAMQGLDVVYKAGEYSIAKDGRVFERYTWSKYDRV